jgi:hypothetical protein
VLHGACLKPGMEKGLFRFCERMEGVWRRKVFIIKVVELAYILNMKLFKLTKKPTY